MDVDGAMGIDLQEEIIMDILSGLPVRSLLRFKCVSRFWMTSISEPYFTMKHLNHAKNNQNSQKYLLANATLIKRTRTIQLVEERQKLDWPSNAKQWSRTLYCCYDSLALIGCLNYPDKHFLLLLWNPSTRESIVLPDPKFSPEEYPIYGLGYDSTSDDYKILIIDLESRSEILGLKSGSWRKIDRHPTGVYPELADMDSLAFVHGAFHWLGQLTDVQMCSIFSRLCRIGVSLLGEMFCAYSHMDDIFKFWVMKDYGVKESWTELFNIRDTDIYSAVPKYRFSDGEVLLWCMRLKPLSSVFRTSKAPFGLWPHSAWIRLYRKFDLPKIN
ncbi:hypothetical protein RND71_004483 [Anisodus tanguticus]|uniref:F-box domain-containing protein n=1 Tax=Anisodus tanguticus TaxID=243964 RepID=A0AAE1SSA7_9SOLA|nr:hypothetical protein RND71_004483 [Anisodus tanguticus]